MGSILNIPQRRIRPEMIADQQPMPDSLYGSPTLPRILAVATAIKQFKVHEPYVVISFIPDEVPLRFDQTLCASANQSDFIDGATEWVT